MPHACTSECTVVAGRCKDCKNHVMFKFVRELIESFKEGVAEGKSELESERLAEYAPYEAALKVREQCSPTVENLALALSCPFRSVLTSGVPLRLMEFGHLGGSEVESLRKLLRRDFGLDDAAGVSNALDALEEAHDEEGNLARSVFLAGIDLYVLTSAVEVGYLSFHEVEALCRDKINFISIHADSWRQFGQLFMEGECINNFIGRRFLKKSVQSLLEEDTSPWRIFSWESIPWVLGSVP